MKESRGVVVTWYSSSSLDLRENEWGRERTGKGNRAKSVIGHTHTRALRTYVPYTCTHLGSGISTSSVESSCRQALTP